MKPLVCITGAAGGLGKAFAVECANRGWDLFLTDISETALSRFSESLSNTYGIKVIYRQCDLTDYTRRTELFDYMQENRLSFKLLINVAGLDYEGMFSDRTREEIRTILRLNIEANLEMTYSVLKLRDPNQTFRVINVASLAAFYSMPVKAMYSASKRFLLNFSMALREEIKPLGCTVTALCPAGMPTTPECISSIDSQGIMGIATTRNVGFVAAHTIDHALKGHAVYIPGMINRVLKFFGSLVPTTVIAWLIGKRWKATHRRKVPLVPETN